MAIGPTSNPAVMITQRDNTNQIASTVADAVAAAPQQPPSLPAFPTVTSSFDQQRYASDLAFVASNVTRDTLPTEQLSADVTLPGILASAFRTGNSLGSLVSNGYGTVPGGAPMTTQEVMSKARVDGFAPYLDAFAYVQSERQYAETVAALRRQQDDNKTLAASGISGTAALLMAGILDIPLVSPGGTLALRGVAAAGKGRVAAGAALGVTAAAETAFTESIITTNSPIPHDGMFENIAGATILGNLLGFAIGRRLGPAVEAQAASRLDAVRADAAEGFPKATAEGQAVIDTYAGSAGAARADARSNADIRASAENLPSLGVNATLGALGKAPVIGEYLRIPRIDLENSPFAAARKTLDMLMGKMNPNITTADNAHVPRSEGAFDAASRFEGQAAQAVREANDIGRVAIKNGEYLNYDEFDKAVARELTTMRDGDVVNEMSTSAQKAAKAYRDGAFEPVRKQHVENGNFREHMEPVNAHAYFPLVADGEAIQRAKGDFETPGTFLFEQYQALKRELQTEVQRAEALKATVKKTQEDIRVRIKGKIVREDNGVTSGGKPKYKYTVAQEGEYQTTLKDIEEKAAIARNSAIDDITGVEIDAARQRSKLDADKADVIAAARAEDFTKYEAVNRQIAAIERQQLADEIAINRQIRALEANRTDNIAAARGDEEFAGKPGAKERRVAALRAEFDAQIAKLENQIAVGKEKSAAAVKQASDKAASDADKARTKRITDIEKDFARQKAKLEDTAKKDLAAAKKAKKDLDGVIDELITSTKAHVDAEYKAEVASHNLPDGVEATLKYRDPEKLDARARELANYYYGQYTGTNRFVLPHHITPGSKGAMKERVQPMAHTLMMDRGWALDKASEIAYMHARLSGTEAALGKYFKKDGPVEVRATGETVKGRIGDPTLTEARKAIEEEGRLAIENVVADPALVRKIEREHGKALQKANGDPKKIAEAEAAREAALTGARAKAEQTATLDTQRALQSLETLMNFARGNRSMSGTPQSVRNTLEVLGAVNAITKMGGSVLSSLTDPANIAIANGLGRTMSYGIVPAIKQFATDWRSASPEARRLSTLAAANTETVLTATMAAHSDILNPLSKGTGVMDATRKSTKLFFKYTGLEGWTSMWKQIAYMTSQSRLLENAERGWGQLGHAEKTWLSALGIDAKTLDNIKAQWKSQTITHENGAPIADWDKWADKATAETLRQALHAEGYNNIVSPHFSDKMTMERSPFGSMLLQFKRFTLAHQAHVVGRNAQLMRSEGFTGAKSLEVYGGLASLVFLAALVDASKKMAGDTTAFGESKASDEGVFDRYIAEWEKNPGGQTYNVLDRTSVIGLALMGSQMLETTGLPSLKKAFAYAGNDENKQKFSSRASQQGVGEAVLGPTFGLANDVLGVARHASNSLSYHVGLGDEPEYNRADWRRERRLIPGSNAPIIQQILNTGEKYMGTIYNWPEQ